MALPILSSLRLRATEFISSPAGPSRAFSASAVVGRGESAAKANARRKRAKVLQLREARAAEAVAMHADPILGSPHAGPSSEKSLYEGSRLQRTVLRAEDVWYSPPPNYAAGEEPAQYLPGLSEADRELLFGALPHASAALAFDPERPAASAAAAADQAKQTEAVQRILDLRNASKKGIEVVNRARIIDEFGRTTASGQKDTASSEVQAALLTHKIRQLWEHVDQNSRDKRNRRALRLLVHKRAAVLKYLRRTDEATYLALLPDLGLAPSAVEGEIKVGM